MAAPDLLYLLLYAAIILAAAKPLGLYMTAVYEGRRTWLHRAFAPVEAAIYRVGGVQPEKEQNWKQYAVAVLLFSALSFLLLYIILRTQEFLPFNPEGLPGVSPGLAFNTAVSFTTNTNWQAYSGESAMSYFSQAFGLTFQNFVSASAGIAVLVALIRGLARSSTHAVGNFWVDLTRGVLYILLPLSIILAVILVSQGVVQNFDGYREVTTVEGASQTLPMGPAASQVAIKQLGTNGGGFFGVNSAHPFENPNHWTNLFQTIAILLIPAGLVYMYGKMVGSTRHGWVVLGVMMAFLVAESLFVTWSEQQGTPALEAAGVATAAGDGQPGGNMEGKEVRFGMGESALWGTATTLASNGSVNSMHDSYTPLGGLVFMANMATGEAIFGGVGAGMYSMALYILLAVFIAGLMVGRSPRYLGKKVEAAEMKAVMVALFSFVLVVLGFAAIASVTDTGTGSLNNPGAHGLSEIMYAFLSGGGNNGSAFAGLNANTTYYNLTIGIAMLVGRFFFIVPVLAIAGMMAAKSKAAPDPAADLPVDRPLFGVVLASTLVVVGLLTFFPAFAVGPIVEHLQMRA
jgi:K+-transporting ATPase ATPase A chain